MIKKFGEEELLCGDNMNKNEWEIFWEWLCTETYDYEECGVHSWLNDKKNEWESFEICPHCNVPGLKKESDIYNGYVVEKYDRCQNCMETFNHENLWDDVKSKIITEIESGYKSPRDIRYLVEKFNLKEHDVSKMWVKEVIGNFRREVEEAKEFAKLAKEKKDAWQKELKKRLQRVVENDKKRKDN